MWKFLLLVGLLPLILSFFARKYFCDRVLRRYEEEKITPSAKSFAKSVIQCGEVKGVEVVAKRRLFLRVKPDEVIIPPAIIDSKLASNVAEAGLRAGLTLMARRQKKVVDYRVWAVKFSRSLPSYTIIVVIFAWFMSGLSLGWAMGIVTFSAGLGCTMLWLTQTVEREAAKLVSIFLDEKRLINRRSESELVEKLVKARAWKRIWPL